VGEGEWFRVWDKAPAGDFGKGNNALLCSRGGKELGETTPIRIRDKKEKKGASLPLSHPLTKSNIVLVPMGLRKGGKDKNPLSTL